MKLNKLIIISMILLAILSLSVVSAVNETEDSTEISEDILSSSLDDEIYQETEVIVTSDNFFEYFDNDGYQISNSNLTFQGDFNGIVKHISITNPTDIDGKNATFNDMGIKIVNDNVKINGLTLISNHSIGDLIYIESTSNVVLSNLTINYYADDESAKVINVFDSDNTSILNNKITFESNIPTDESEALGINIQDSNNILIDSNIINSYFPILLVNTFEELGSNNLNSIRAKTVNKLRIINNKIDVTPNAFSQERATIQGMLLSGVTDSLVSRNNISIIDDFCSEGDFCCLYGCCFVSSNNLTISFNNFNMFTEGGGDESGTAYPIQGATSTVNIIGNNLSSKSNGPNIGIYVASLGGEESKLNIRNNYINITGFATSTGPWALVSGIEIQNGDAEIYNNTVYTYNVNNYHENNYIFAISYAQWMHGNRSFDIQNNLLVTEGKYTVSTIATKEGETTPLTVMNNQLQAHELTGSQSVYTINEGLSICISNNTDIEGNVINETNSTNNETDYNSTDVNSTDDENITINVCSVWQGKDNRVLVVIPNQTGDVTININDNQFNVNLIGGIATQILPHDILSVGENTLTVRYNNMVKTTKFNVLNGIVNKNNVLDYFNQSNNGKLFDYIPEGVTLDFQGEILSTEIGIDNIYINRAMNLISSTHDAYIDLNTVAVGMQGENVGNRFTIDKNGSKTNVTGITFHNTQLWLTNTDHVILDNISVIVLNQKIGSGVGVTSIRDNSTYITVKNSYFSTYNNGGSSTLVLAWANNCIVENNTITAEGNVGNLFYLNTYNVVIPENALINAYNTIKNNVIHGPSHSSVICRALAYGGSNNLIENNTIYYSGEGIYSADNAENLTNITVTNNRLYNGSSMSILGGVKVYDNYISGNVHLRNNAQITNCTFYGLTISGDNALVYNNTINGAVTIEAVFNAQIKDSKITGDISIALNGENIIISGNTITGALDIKGSNNIIEDNSINSSGQYAVTITNSKAKNNNITYNFLYAMDKFGDDAVNDRYNNNLIINNLPITGGLAVRVYDIKVGENETVQIWINETASGVVKVIFNNTEKEVSMNNGYGTFNIPNLSADTYEIKIQFIPEGNYASQIKTEYFTVSKYTTSIEDAVRVDIIDNKPIFTLNLSSEFTGNFTVRINKVDYIEVINNGKSIINISNLTSGNYNAILIYSGNEMYELASATVSFIIKHELTVNAVVNDINVGDEAVFNITLPYDATGIVNIIINDVYYNGTVNNGKTIIKVPDLVYGKYNVTVKYSGDNNYLSSENRTELTVSKIKITNDCIEVVESDVIITLPEDATGILTVDDKSSEVTAGTAKVNLDLVPGEYEFIVIYSGDDKYANISKTIKLNISKYSSHVLASVDDIEVDEIAIFNITVPYDATGNVSVIINDKYYNATLNNGKITVNVSDLKYGTYNVIVKYSGDNKYFGSENNTKLTVQRYNISNDCISVDNLVVSINLPQNATGCFTVNNQSVNIIDGKAYVTLDLTPGVYEFIASYSGDDKYENVSKTITFNIPKYDSFVDVTYNNITVGDKAVFNIHVPDGATGRVNVTVNNIIHNKTLNNGMAIVEVSDLSFGTYTILIKYLGDKNYSSKNITLTLVVSKVKLSEDLLNLTASHASVNLSGEASGKLEVVVDGRTYEIKSLVDGFAQINIQGLSFGNHIIKAIYSGDDKYEPISKSISVNIPNPHVPVIRLMGSDVVMLYTSGSSYKVRLTSDGTALSGKKVTIAINGVVSTVVTDKNGFASVIINLPPKSTNYIVTAEYNGIKTSNNVKVNSILSAKNLKVKKSAKTLKIKVTLKKVNGKYIKSKKVSLKFNGKTYKVKTNKKGIATFKIPKKAIKKLKAGKKYTYQITFMKDTIKKSVTVKK